jgi:hypothetical protein
VKNNYGQPQGPTVQLSQKEMLQFLRIMFLAQL